MAPHSSTLAWKIPWMEEPGRLQSMGSLRVGTTERLHFHFSLSCIGDGNGNPLQCSCLENPRDGGAWYAAVYGVAQSQTRLKRLSSSSRRKERKGCKEAKSVCTAKALISAKVILWLYCSFSAIKFHENDSSKLSRAQSLHYTNQSPKRFNSCLFCLWF